VDLAPSHVDAASFVAEVRHPLGKAKLAITGPSVAMGVAAVSCLASLGLADQLKKALHTYTESGGQGERALDQKEAVALMLRHEMCCSIFHGFDWTMWTTGTSAQRLSVLPAAQEHVLAEQGGKDRLLVAVVNGAVEGFRDRGTARRGHPHSRRRRLLSGRAAVAVLGGGGRVMSAGLASTVSSAAAARTPRRPVPSYLDEAPGTSFAMSSLK
jgi:hypothetical protein